MDSHWNNNTQMTREFDIATNTWIERVTAIPSLPHQSSSRLEQAIGMNKLHNQQAIAQHLFLGQITSNPGLASVATFPNPAAAHHHHDDSLYEKRRLTKKQKLLLLCK